MHKGILVYVIILIIIIVLFYIETGFRLPVTGTTTAPLTSTTAGPYNTSNSVATTTLGTLYPCSDFQIYESGFNKTDTERCLWTGGALGVWVAAGNSSSEHLKITGSNNVTYVNQTSPYDCVTFYKNLTAPQQIYTITFTTGPGGGSCGAAVVKLNTTTAPPAEVYGFVYNGNFSNGEFSGWNVSGKGFGSSPFNLTYANGIGCYIGAPWDTFNGIVQFAASTYHCGTQPSPGNITSSPFIVNKPFLNFKIISPGIQDLYVEILHNGAPAIIAHYNTYNATLGGNPPSTFRNASIPLTSLAGKTVSIRIVAATLSTQRFISVAGFQLSSVPLQQQGILTNLTIYNTT